MPAFLIHKAHKVKELYKNLKFSKRTMPFEYAVVEKIFREPLELPSKFGGMWYSYKLRVSEINTIDENTGQAVVLTDVEEASMGATESLNEMIKDVEVNRKFKISKETIEGAQGEYTKFKVTFVDPNTTDISNDDIDMDMGDDLN